MPKTNTYNTYHGKSAFRIKQTQINKESFVSQIQTDLSHEAGSSVLQKSESLPKLVLNSFHPEKIKMRVRVDQSIQVQPSEEKKRAATRSPKKINQSFKTQTNFRDTKVVSPIFT